MSPVIIVIIVVIIGAIVLFSHESTKTKASKAGYLDRITRLYDGKFEQLEDFDNCFKVSFSYRGRDFYFLEVSDSEFNRVVTKGYLKSETPTDLKLSFTERPRSDVKVNIQSIQDISTPWGKDTSIRLPRELSEFSIHTNHPHIVKKLFEDDRIVRMLASFKNRDSRGHPLMSLDFNDGILTLEFHASNMLRPNLWDLQHNVSTLQGFLDQLAVLLQVVREEWEKSL